jgi:hypothetical protein
MSRPLYPGTRQIAVTVDMPLTHGSFDRWMNGGVATRIRSTAIHEQKLSRGSCWRNPASKLPSVLARKQILGTKAIKERATGGTTRHLAHRPVGMVVGAADFEVIS